MCDKCQELEKKIERYRTLATRVFDQPTIEAINKLIEEMQAEKAGLHPECKWGRLRPLLARRDFWEAAYGRPTKALIRRDTRCRDAAPLSVACPRRDGGRRCGDGDAVKVEFATYDKEGKLIASTFTYVSAIPAGESRSSSSYADLYRTEKNASVKISNVNFAK